MSGETVPTSGRPDFGFPVDLPGGGTMFLMTQEESDMFEAQSKKYQEEFALSKLNDLVLVGAILTQGVILYRAQQRLAGMEPEFRDGRPTGKYRTIEKQSASDLGAAQTTITKAATEIRELEKALGIDKKTRESGGQHTVADYLANLKRAGHQMGVRINERITEYEKVMMESRWKLRVLANGDDEDKAYHDLNEEKFCEWLRTELAGIEQKDKDWAKTAGKIFIGRL